jgi:type IV secretory pathway VirB4 component
MKKKSRENQDNWSIISMEFERYEDVIDAFERDNMGYETLTDYIKGQNIKIADPMPDNQESGIMATDEATMMAEGPQQTDYRDPFLVEEYEKYLYDMMEQGLQPMSFEEFRREAMAGMAKAQPEEIEEIKEKKVISLAGGGISELLEA